MFYNICSIASLYKSDVFCLYAMIKSKEDLFYYLECDKKHSKYLTKDQDCLLMRYGDMKLLYARWSTILIVYPGGGVYYDNIGILNTKS